MKRTWLVQRLNKPIVSKNPDSPLAKLGSLFSFGGGLVNGGITKAGSELISKIWRFDYMGAAEYEWGVVPEALSRIAKLAADKQLFVGSLNLTGSRMKDEHTRVDCPRTIWFFCANVPEEIDHVVAFLQREANDRPNGPARDHKLRTRDRTNIHREMNSDWEDQKEENQLWRTSGGLECDNGFLYFFDHPSARQTAELFEVVVPLGNTHGVPPVGTAYLKMP